jgi:hypothetical protein
MYVKLGAELAWGILVCLTRDRLHVITIATVLHFLPKAVLAPGSPPRWPAAQKVERPPSTVHSQCGADDEFQGAIGFACARVTTRAYKRLRVATLCFGGLVPIAEHYVANRRC